MKNTINGKFSVKAIPQPDDETIQKIGAMKMTFEKQFEGALHSQSLVSMIGMMNQSIGSGGYVALEKVTGALEGRQGSFCLQHSSIMERGKPQQSITVIPDTGTDQLVGLVGQMTIDIIDGQHFYNFEYQLP